MAVQGSGLGRGPDPAMHDQTTFNARAGAAKHPQTSFQTKWGMKDQTGMNGVGPGNPGSGPDASSPDPMDPSSRGKTLRKQPSALQSSWGMKDANGKGVDPNIGGKVLGEAILGGAHLPSSVSK